MCTSQCARVLYIWSIIPWVLFIIVASVHYSVNANMHSTEIASVLNRNCYEQGGKMVAEQFYKLKVGGGTGMWNCGPVLSCLESPCNTPIYRNVVYVVGWNGIYQQIAHYNGYAFAYFLFVFMWIMLALAIALGICAQYTQYRSNITHESSSTQYATV